MTTDDRIRAALEAQANQVGEHDLRPAQPPAAPAASIAGHHPRRVRWAAPLLAAAAVVAVVVGTAIAVTGGGNSAERHVSPGDMSSHTPMPTPTPTSAASGSRSSALGSLAPVSTTVSASRTQAQPTGRPACVFAELNEGCYRVIPFEEPLWPFATYGAAKQWEDVDGPNGHQPWHADAKATALAFVTGYLGFTDITTVTSAKIGADGAQIGVGYLNPAGALHTAAVLSLARYELYLGDAKAPWEVTGTANSDFFMDQPLQGSQVHSPMTVGGRITGVDENIVVSVKNRSGQADTMPGLPAGGTNSPWSETVPFTQTGVLTIVAFTGGHVTQHERFAVVGVHT